MKFIIYEVERVRDDGSDEHRLQFWYLDYADAVDRFKKLVSADGYIEWDDTELLEDNPDYFECPECGEECWCREDVDGDEYWWCDDCEQAFNDDGDEVFPDFEEDEE